MDAGRRLPQLCDTVSLVTVVLKHEAPLSHIICPYPDPRSSVFNQTSTNTSVCSNQGISHQRPHHNDWVTLNVGGKHFTTTR